MIYLLKAWPLYLKTVMCSECDQWRTYYSKPENMTNQCTTCRQYQLQKEFTFNPITKRLKRTCNTCNVKFRCSNCTYTGAYRVGYEKHLKKCVASLVE